MRKLALALILVLAFGTSAKACNPVATAAVITPGFGGAVLAPQFGGSFTPFGVVSPGFGFGFNTFATPFGFNNFAVASPFVGGFGGVNVAVAAGGGFRGRAFVGGRGRAVVRTRTVVRGR